MSGDGQQEQLPAGQVGATEKYEMGFKRESWCAVLMQKEQDWCRATRKHYRENFSSTVFSSGGPSESEPRCTFQVNKATHLQRRHFPGQCKYPHTIPHTVHSFIGSGSMILICDCFVHTTVWNHLDSIIGYSIGAIV